MKAMAKDRDRRFKSADEVRAAIEAIEPVSGDKHARPPVARRESDQSSELSPTAAPLRREDLDAWERSLKRKRWMGLLAIPLLLSVAAAAVVVWVKTSAPRARDEEQEPNDSAAQANWIASEKTVRGHIGDRITAEKSDTDFYQFNVARGAWVLRAELTGIPTMDLKLELYDRLGKRIVESDGGTVGDGEILPNVRLIPGDYYVAVREVWVGGRPAQEDATNWYTLTVSWRPLGANLESEPDDSPAQALPLSLDQPTRGYLGRSGDVDYFYLRGEGGGMLSGTLSAMEGVDARLVVLPPGSQSGPPGPLPAGAKVFDKGGPGEPEALEGVSWTAGGPGPILVVERKDLASGAGLSPRSGLLKKPQAEAPRPPLVGLDTPYSLTVRMGH